MKLDAFQMIEDTLAEHGTPELVPVLRQLKTDNALDYRIAGLAILGAYRHGLEDARKIVSSQGPTTEELLRNKGKAVGG